MRSDSSGGRLAVLVHEIRNPLQGLSGVLQRLAEESLGGRQRQLVHGAMLSLEQLCELLGRHGDAAGAASNVYRAKRQWLHGVELLETAIWHHSTAARGKNIKLLLLVEPGVPAVWRSDGSLLLQVLDNLLSNAVKFTQRGEIVVRAAFREKTEGGGRLRLSVRDSGIGLAPEVLPGIADQAACYQGQGLGLPISEHCARALGADLVVSDHSGAGCKATLDVPLAAGEFRHPVAATRALLSGLCALIDLDGFLRKSMVALLARLGVANRRPGERIGNGPCIVVTEGGLGRPGILLQGTGFRSRGERVEYLEFPLLESTLGPILIEWMIAEIADQ